MKPDNSLGEGVYYAIEDYAGFFRRITVLLIDNILLLGFGYLLWGAFVAMFWEPGTMFGLVKEYCCTWFFCIWLYLTVIKRSKLGTVAYLILGLKIVNTKGQRPSILRMTFRMLLWLFGPINLIIDLLWLGADAERQTLRACYAGTYVLRKRAEPIGTGPVHLTRYCGGGLTLSYPRVVRPKPST